MECLPHAQRQLWPLLKPAAPLGYVLYGGTAIALRLGHRVSVDFDFFSNHGLDITALHAAMPFLEAATVAGWFDCFGSTGWRGKPGEAFFFL